MKLCKSAKVKKGDLKILADFPGSSKFICANFELRCLNMGSEKGRECNYSDDCGYKVERCKVDERQRKN